MAFLPLQLAPVFDAAWPVRHARFVARAGRNPLLHPFRKQVADGGSRPRSLGAGWLRGSFPEAVSTRLRALAQQGG